MPFPCITEPSKLPSRFVFLRQRSPPSFYRDTSGQPRRATMGKSHKIRGPGGFTRRPDHQSGHSSSCRRSVNHLLGRRESHSVVTATRMSATVVTRSCSSCEAEKARQSPQTEQNLTSSSSFLFGKLYKQHASPCLIHMTLGKLSASCPEATSERSTVLCDQCKYRPHQ